MKQRFVFMLAGMLMALLALFALPALAQVDERVWELLKSGGQVVLMRHALTESGIGDPPGMRLDDCRTQRNLSDGGRRHARRIGDAFRARDIRIGQVLSSPWCRCMETARLAFGKAEATRALGNLFGRAERAASQVREMKALVSKPRGGANLILVSHGSTILALTGISPDNGEMVVISPQEDGRFTVRGRLAVQ